MELVRIETERLILREFTQDDMEAFFKIYSNEKINRFLPKFQHDETGPNSFSVKMAFR